MKIQNSKPNSIIEIFKNNNLKNFLDEKTSLVSNSLPLYLISYFKFIDKPILVITPKNSMAEELVYDINAIEKNISEFLPSTEVLPFENISPLTSISSKRNRCRLMAKQGIKKIYVASVNSISSKVAPLEKEFEPLEIKINSEIDRDSLIQKLLQLGFNREYQVEAKGEFAVRGEIVDIYPGEANHPIRLNFFGDEIEKINNFDIASQTSAKVSKDQSVKKIEKIKIYPCKEFYITDEIKQKAQLFIDKRPWAENVFNGVYSDGVESYIPWITTKSGYLYDELVENGLTPTIIDKEQCNQIMHNLTEEETQIKEELKFDDNSLLDGSGFMDEKTFVNIKANKTLSTFASVDSTIEAKAVGPLYDLSILKEKLEYWKNNKYKIYLSGDNSYSLKKLADYIQDFGYEFDFEFISFTKDIELQKEKTAIINEQNFSRHMIPRKKPVEKSKNNKTSYADLNAGNYVVHSVHGIGKFLGIEQKSFMEVEREYLHIEFKGGDKLFLPVEQMFTIRKYSGSDAPKLNKMGGSDFAKTKARVKRETNHIAQQLVQLYRIRHETKGFAFSQDSPWQKELEDSFEYELTVDQAKSLKEIKHDMESEIPMDRLLCGDVGFGKTEVAIRAAFKAVQDNKQVVVLAPTTLLAHQHYNTFVDRLKNFPTKVEVLSRFVSSKKQTSILNETKLGSVDILIGTHRVLSSDVDLKDCGLLIVDEEQRFGVNHKEKIKQKYTSIDVLTLTATPIPRSLEMSVTGIREISVINTPPTNRRPILTSVNIYDETVVTEAIRREMLREGQVFYLHNKVKDIELVVDKLKFLLPNAKIDFAHGQMSEAQLESTIQKVWERKTDVLVTTTIVESGLDLPYVNTLIVNNAHKFGLAQLYQLRGRVGRRGQRAYAYMMYPENTSMTEQAYERLKVIGDFTDLGSGYKIAMRDLEIRGAGSLLGESQSGHIASVGFDIYCQMVKESVDQIKGIEPPKETDISVDIRISAFIPDEYIERQDLKLDAYTKIAMCEHEYELQEAKEELIDRYGDLPIEVENLTRICSIKIILKKLGLSSVKEFNNQIIFGGKLSELLKVRTKRYFPRSVITDNELRIPISNIVREPEDILSKLLE